MGLVVFQPTPGVGGGVLGPGRHTPPVRGGGRGRWPRARGEGCAFVGGESVCHGGGGGAGPPPPAPRPPAPGSLPPPPGGGPGGPDWVGLQSLEDQSKGLRLGFQSKDMVGCWSELVLPCGFILTAPPPPPRMVWPIALPGPQARVGLLPPSTMVRPNRHRTPGLAGPAAALPTAPPAPTVVGPDVGHIPILAAISVWLRALFRSASFKPLLPSHGQPGLIT